MFRYMFCVCKLFLLPGLCLGLVHFVSNPRLAKLIGLGKGTRFRSSKDSPTAFPSVGASLHATVPAEFGKSGLTAPTLRTTDQFQPVRIGPVDRETVPPFLFLVSVCLEDKTMPKSTETYCDRCGCDVEEHRRLCDVCRHFPTIHEIHAIELQVLTAEHPHTRPKRGSISTLKSGVTMGISTPQVLNESRTICHSRHHS